jgi:hypothetical protein
MKNLLALVVCAGLASSVRADDGASGASDVKPKKTIAPVAHFSSGGSGRSPNSSGIHGFQSKMLSKPVIPVRTDPVKPYAPNCPAGTTAVHNAGGIVPYTCVKNTPDPKPWAPNCPEGTKAVHNASGIVPYTCVKTDPEPKPWAPNCPAGTVARHNEGGGLAPYTCVKVAREPAVPLLR